MAAATTRIASLVPSITELPFDLGLQANVVGRTGFRIHPKELVRKVSKVGGTKTIDLARLKRLTHLIVNIDANPRDAQQQRAISDRRPHRSGAQPAQPRPAVQREPYSFRKRHCVEVLDAMPERCRMRVALIDAAMTS